MTPGLVSVTFRKKTVAEICALCVRAGLKCVEWGGDVHVTDIKSAREARKLCEGSGLDIVSYGSYFRVGGARRELERCVEIARSMDCDTVRIWCGSRGSDMPPNERARVVSELISLCDAVRNDGVTLALEFHGGTLTDSLPSVISLLGETAEAGNLRFLWQPRWDRREEERMEALRALKARLAHIHAFTWRHDGENVIRLPLGSESAFWRGALAEAGDAPALLEFVRGDSERAFFEDAETLINISRS